MLQKTLCLIIYLIVFCLPLYLIKFKIDWVNFNVLEIMIYLTFILWLIKGKIRDFLLKARKPGFFYPVFLIFLGATLSTIFSSNIQASAGIWKSWIIAPLLFFIVVLDIIKTREQIRNVIFSLFLSGFGAVLIALFYWFNNNLTYDGRLRAFYLSPNHLAMYLSPILILSFYLYACFKKRISKISLFIVHCLMFIVLFLTYSFGAWLGLLAAFVFVLFVLLKKSTLLSFWSKANEKSKVIESYEKHSRFYHTLGSLQNDNKSVRIIITFFLLIVILFFAFQIHSQKFQGIMDFSYPAWQSRLAIWQSALEIIKDHALIGVGPGMFQKYYLDYQVNFPSYPEWAVPQPHNIFLAFWLQTGLLGLIGFIWLIVIFFKNSLGPHPLEGQTLKILKSILIAVMAYILIHGLVDTTYWKNDLSVVFWLITALSCIKARFSYSQTKDSPPKEIKADF